MQADDQHAHQPLFSGYELVFYKWHKNQIDFTTVFYTELTQLYLTYDS